jgi:hypothetical protein
VSGSGRRGLSRRILRLATRGAAFKIALGAGAPLLGLLFVVGLLAAAAPSSGSGAQGCVLSKAPANGVPPNYVPWLLRAASKYKLGPRGFSIVAAVHYVESDFGRSPLPGVAPGTHNYAGAEGPGQFLVPSWAAFGVDGDGDGDKDVYSIPDSVSGTANLLHAAGAPRDWAGAIFSYNHAGWYVEKVESKAAQIGEGGEVVCEPSATPSGPAELSQVETLTVPLAFKPIPSRYWVGGGAPEVVDSRLWPDLIWVLQSFHMQATAARETGHETHGDGTAVDMVPAAGHGWDETARKAAETLGWREGCGGSGTAPVCPLMPAIQFVGYNGYSGHGDPAHAGENAHLHISWQSASFGCAELCPPPRWVRVFPLSP